MKKIALLSLPLISILIGVGIWKWQINKRVEGAIVIAHPCLADKTAFTSLSESGHKVEFETLSFGKIVTSIDGQKQGEGKYWLYSVDSQPAAVGADAYNCKGTEKIEWELK